MLSTARANIRRAGLEHRIRLALGDAARFDAAALFGRRTFDRAFFSYSLSMIPPWRDALAQGFRRRSRPGGRLLIVDFGEQERLPAWFRRSLFAWLAKFHVTPRADLEGALAALAAATAASCRSVPFTATTRVWRKSCARRSGKAPLFSTAKTDSSGSPDAKETP